MTTTLLTLKQRLAEQIGDYLSFDTTTNITTDNSVISTELTSYDGGRDDYFNEWWVYIMGVANDVVERQISDYATSAGTLTVRGAALAAESAAVTCQLHRHSLDLYVDAINDAIREIYPVLHRKLDVAELVTGNILPNSHFRDWASTALPDKWAVSNAAATASTAIGTYRGGKKSAKVTPTATDGYLYISSDTYPRLLDIMDKTVSIRGYAYPEVANDPKLIIYTNDTAGSTQTLSTATAASAGVFTKLELEDQAINDNLEEVQIRCQVASSTKYTYFDHVRLIGADVNEYLLPTDFKDGTIDEVHIQSSGYSDEICDDLHPTQWEKVYGWEIINDGTDEFLKLPYLYPTERLIRLLGYAPLSTVSLDANTVELDGEKVNLLIAYAKYKLYTYIEPPVSTQDIRRYETGSMKAYSEYMRLKTKLAMSKGSPTMNLGVLK